MATCIECGREILWLRLADSGRSIAVNYSMVPGGVLRNEADGARFMKGEIMVPGFMPHRLTCPEVQRESAARKRAKATEKEKKKKRQLGLFE